MGLLKKVQREQRDWAIKNFGNTGAPAKNPIPGHGSLLGAMEELGELCHAHLKESQGIRGTAEEHQAKAKDAIGDIIIYLADYCNRRGFNIEEIVAETWFHVKHRDWTKNKETGIVSDYNAIPKEILDEAAVNIANEIDRDISEKIKILSEACRDCEIQSCSDCVHQ